MWWPRGSASLQVISSSTEGSTEYPWCPTVHVGAGAGGTSFWGAGVREAQAGADYGASTRPVHLRLPRHPSCGDDGVQKKLRVYLQGSAEAAPVRTRARWPSCKVKREGVEEALDVKQGTLYP